MGWKRKLVGMAVATVSSFVLLTGVAFAQSSSTHYQVNEYGFGTGGELNACSTSYCSKQSAGETTVGKTSSTNYQAQAGFNTTDVPVLEVAVNGSVNFGVLNTSTTSSGSANIQVRTYLSSGYDMIIAGQEPNEPNASLDPMASPGAADPGTEQFGINLRANSTPSVGSDPVQIPDSTFSYGQPTGSYNVPDEFMYDDGDIIAHSSSSSGQTNYTLSMIANMAINTPGGTYTTDLSIVVVSSF